MQGVKEIVKSAHADIDKMLGVVNASMKLVKTLDENGLGYSSLEVTLRKESLLLVKMMRKRSIDMRIQLLKREIHNHCVGFKAEMAGISRRLNGG